MHYTRKAKIDQKYHSAYLPILVHYEMIHRQLHDYGFREPLSSRCSVKSDVHSQGV